MKWQERLKQVFDGLFRQKRNEMDLQLTIKDLIPVIALSSHFKKAIRKEVRKQTSEWTEEILNLGDEIMALKDQVEQINAGVEQVKAAAAAEKEQVRVLVESVKNELNTKIADLEAKVNELENTDFSAEIQGLKDVAASIDDISEITTPDPEPEPTPEEPVV